MQLGLSRNVLYMLVGALVVVVAVLGYQLYQDRKEPKGCLLYTSDAADD